MLGYENSPSWFSRTICFVQVFPASAQFVIVATIKSPSFIPTPIILSPLACKSITLPTHKPLPQTCANTSKQPINTSTFASIFYLDTQFPKPHVPKCNINEIELIEGLLFVSMVPLHHDEPEMQKMFYLIGLKCLNNVYTSLK